jgi:hyperosmotically inducible periplasmic protein
MKSLLIASMVAVASIGSIGCAVTSKQETVGQYVDDATITSRVKAKFAQDQQVSAMRINVETMQGIVQLSGFAANELEKDKAAQLARQTNGVKSVRNDIIVKQGS